MFIYYVAHYFKVISFYQLSTGGELFVVFYLIYPFWIFFFFLFFFLTRNSFVHVLHCSVPFSFVPFHFGFFCTFLIFGNISFTLLTRVLLLSYLRFWFTVFPFRNTLRLSSFSAHYYSFWGGMLLIIISSVSDWCPPTSTFNFIRSLLAHPLIISPHYLSLILSFYFTFSLFLSYKVY